MCKLDPITALSDKNILDATNTLAGRDLLRLLNLEPKEFNLIIALALSNKAKWKADPQGMQNAAPYAGRAVGIILEKPSMRTRVSFELATSRLGAYPVVMADSHSAFSRGESLKDTMMVMERFVDVIVIRSFAQSRIEELAAHASVPVINALTDDFHPCQGLADFMTIYEHKGALNKLKIAYVGDGNNMAHTYMEAAALCGTKLTIATPAQYAPNANYILECEAVCAKTGGKLKLTNSMDEALKDADVVITDTWASMGAETEHDERAAVFAMYQIDMQAMLKAAPGAIFMHCLPAHRGEEVTSEVMDASFSVIYDEAENRMHAQQALLQLLMDTL